MSIVGSKAHKELMLNCYYVLQIQIKYLIIISHPGSGSDPTIASVRQVTALVSLYIGRLVTCGIDFSFTP